MAKLTTTDTRLAGFLVSRGALLLGTDVNERLEVVFNFDPGPNGADPNTLMFQFPSSPEYAYDNACKAMYSLVRAKMTQIRNR